MNILHQSIQQNFTNKVAEQEELGDQYFDEAKHKLMKDLVDFNQRDDFEHYMRGLEKNYYEQLNFPKPPYESFPDYPPKPFQQNQKKRQRDDHKKDYIDRANEMNNKRQQAYSQNPYQQQQTQNSSIQSNYYKPQSSTFMDISQTPFFDQIVNKENFQKHTSSYNTSSGNLGQGSYNPVMQAMASKYTPMGQPNYGIPQGKSGGDMYGNMMEPSQMSSQQMPPHMQKFIAGSTRRDQNPLSEPTRSFRNQSPQKSQQFLQMNDYDLKNPDVQFERYKQLMQNQYYNNHANQQQQVEPSARQSNHLNHFEQQQQMHQQVQQNMYTQSFNPQGRGGDMGQQQFQQQQQNPKQGSQMYPNQFYNRPDSSISLYNQQYAPSQYDQQRQQTLQPTGYEAFHPNVYRNLQHQNDVGLNIIESLGGIQDTIKPMQDSFKQHELRPYQIHKDYHKELKRNVKGHRSNSASEMKPENMKLVSVSPFRAVLQYDNSRKHGHNASSEEQQERQQNDDTDKDEEEDEDPADDKLDMYNSLKGAMNGSIRGTTQGGQSPIRNDSEQLRGQREQFLRSFNEQKNLLQNSSGIRYEDVIEMNNGQRNNNQAPPARSHQREYRKMKNHSEYLRNQREGYLNSFSQSRLSHYEDGQGEDNGHGYDY